jgi:ribonuclease Z
MKPNFHASPVNPPFEDPIVYVRLRYERRCLLFDCGDIHRLSSHAIMNVSDVFITHMHIDHFIGFDTVIRTILHRPRPVRFYGPAGITECIEGKLRGYTWNLIHNYPLVVEVYEISSGSIRQSSFAASEAFRSTHNQQRQFQGMVLQEPDMEVSALPLHHAIPSLGYRLNEPFHINIRANELVALGLPVGPWISDLKKTIRAEACAYATAEDAIKHIAEKGYSACGRHLQYDDLTRLLLITRGQSFAYIMDTTPEQKNIDAITAFVRGVDELFCEAYFLDDDRERAFARHHLTALHAGSIAQQAAVGRLTVLHFSPKYRDCPDRLYQEAERFFINSGH